MKICVCFKIVNDYEDMDSRIWNEKEIREGNNRSTAFSYSRKVYSYYDEAALETALRYKEELEESGKTVHLTALTYGNGPRSLFTRLYAIGFDTVVRIREDPDMINNPMLKNSDLSLYKPSHTGAVLSSYLINFSFDFILMGKMAEPLSSGLVPAHVASRLGIPLIENVAALHYDPANDRTILTSSHYNTVEMTEEIYRIISDPPVVLSISDVAYPYLRSYTLKQRREALKKAVIEWSFDKSVSEENPFSSIILIPKDIPKQQCNYLKVMGGTSWRKLLFESIFSLMQDSESTASKSNAESESSYTRRNVFSGHMEAIFRPDELIKPGNIIPYQGTILSSEFHQESKDIANQDILFIAGRGIGSRKNYETLKRLGKNLDIPVACSRPIAMNGWEHFSKVIGISGKILQAKVVITIGISGSSAFMAGLEKTKHIIAVNNDPEAPIFRYAKTGFLCDCIRFIEELSPEEKGCNNP